MLVFKKFCKKECPYCIKNNPYPEFKVENGKVKEFDVINHSYTDSGERVVSKTIISTNGIFPTITTRPDTLGVVVDE